MVIKHGQDWGREDVAPSDLAWASSDSALADCLGEGHRNVVVTGGDMWRTIGSENRAVVAGEAAMCLPIDIMKVEFRRDDESIVSKIAVAHVVLRRSNIRGGWLRGSLTIAANAQFLGHWDIAPRGHPNDGRVEITQVDEVMGLRQRLTARARLSTGSHLPHPLIQTKSMKNFVWEGDSRSHQVLWIDRQLIGRVKSLSVEVCNDEAFLWM
ncbi:unannotated protein [freshwater metagenome]|uniref:Unannotated protein n=1 Tax=freshwater metagenome TaxID=449393 RepID=A0A6J6VSF3_9ZZZZ|nr:hypothetical protein [Actinomycetota bacterium]MSX36646.1 hypothetical protein [Actinomycetota bacterium]MSX77385.1 hypothetical protein [Actinomycetota bacterium]MSZ71776.1 hypothetical protein [Actinomycetota bacterium]MUH56503.1 hypothetical protein [Actinomycetota bacterium]